jgi:hypothetical protein
MVLLSLALTASCCTIANASTYTQPQEQFSAMNPNRFKLNSFVFGNTKWTDSFPVSAQALADSGMSGSPPIQLIQNIPQILRPLTPQTIAFNHAIKDFAASIWATAGGPLRTQSREDMSSDYELDYIPNANALPGIISIFFTLSNWTHVAAHGEWKNIDFNWNVAKSRQIIPGDIFNHAADWKLGVSTMGLKAFSDLLQDSYDTPDAESWEGAFADPQSWALLKSGLRVDTSAYEIGGYGGASPSAVIPWAALKPYLRPDGLVQP